MVDLSTAMAAAAASDKRRGGRGGDDKKRPGGMVGTEPFDPVDHVEKEKADTASMWLVVLFGTGIALFMRYVIMPQMNGPASVLWSLPLLLILTLPTLHRQLLKRFADRYTFGNWFRGGFLYTFTWLAVSFIVVNPPLADISPPEVAGRAVLLDIDDPDAWQQRVGYVEDTGDLPEHIGFAFAVRDNLDAQDVYVTVRLTVGSNTTTIAQGIASELRGDWDAVSANVSKVKTKATDVPILVDLNQSFQSGVTYKIEVTLSQDGEPWELVETVSWKFQVGPAR